MKTRCPYCNTAIHGDGVVFGSTYLFRVYPDVRDKLNYIFPELRVDATLCRACFEVFAPELRNLYQVLLWRGEIDANDR